MSEHKTHSGGSLEDYQGRSDESFARVAFNANQLSDPTKWVVTEAQMLSLAFGTPKLLILWHGVDEFEVTEASLEKAIGDVKSDRRYYNYGRRGASIVSFQTLYEIDGCGNEKVDSLVLDGQIIRRPDGGFNVIRSKKASNA